MATIETPGDVTVTSISRIGLTFETAIELAEGVFYSLLLEHQGHEAKVVVDVKWVTPLSAEVRKASSPSFRVGASFFDIRRGSAPGIWKVLQPDD